MIWYGITYDTYGIWHLRTGMLKNPLTYEIMTPESVGLKSALVLGKHSGRNAVRSAVVTAEI